MRQKLDKILVRRYMNTHYPTCHCYSWEQLSPKYLLENLTQEKMKMKD